MTKKNLTKLGAAMNAADWAWLQHEDSRLADALEVEVAQGADPDEIARFVIGDYGSNREALARRMRSAAVHLQALQVKA